MLNKKIYFDEIGEVLVKKSNKTKKLYIKIEPHKGIKVTIPQNLTFKTAEKFIFSKKNWIIKSLKKVAELEKNITIFSEKTKYKTRDHILNIESQNRDNISVRVTKKNISVKYPENIDVKDKLVQDAIREGIEKALRKEAKNIIPKRVEYYAKKYGFKYNNIAFKNAKTRWGSCSSKKNLNFNIHLMRLPDLLIDYVILHELAHTKELNHSKKYWQILDNIYGNAKSIDKKLKDYKIQIF